MPQRTTVSEFYIVPLIGRHFVHQSEECSFFSFLETFAQALIIIQVKTCAVVQEMRWMLSSYAPLLCLARCVTLMFLTSTHYPGIESELQGNYNTGEVKRDKTETWASILLKATGFPYITTSFTIIGLITSLFKCVFFDQTSTFICIYTYKLYKCVCVCVCSVYHIIDNLYKLCLYFLYN